MFIKCLLLAAATASFGAPFAAAATGGSLIHPDTYRGIAADRKAHKIGDALTVVVLEAAKAESQAGTGAVHDFDVTGTAADSIGTRQFGLGLSGNDDGQGQTSRQGSLTAELTVRVTAVEPNGLLRVKGAQNILINGEKQTIEVEGLVREQDISSANTVLSTRLSGATIHFTGDGVVTESQRHGIIYRFLNWLGLM